MARRTRFRTWCAKDPYDETKIWYTFRKKYWDGTTRSLHFTSEDFTSCIEVSLGEIAYAWIESISLEDDGWHVVLYND